MSAISRRDVLTAGVTAGVGLVAAAEFTQAADTGGAPLKRTAPVKVTPAAKQGMDEEGLERLRRAIRADIAAKKSDGSVMVIGRRGSVVFHEAFGFADRDADIPMKLDNVFSTASTFKQITNASVLQCIERGQLSFTTQIPEIIPEYGSRGKEHTTITDLMCHTAGLPFDAPPLPPEQIGDIQAVTAYICGIAPVAPPGTEVLYSAMAGHSVLAEIVRRLDGGKRPFRQIVEENLLKPLGMYDTVLGGRHDLVERWAPAVLRDMTPGLFNPQGRTGKIPISENLRLREGYEVPGGGALSTPYDFYRFAEACRRGGEIDGHRILSPATIKRASTINTGSLPNHLWSYARQMRGWREFPANLGPGFFVRGEGIFPHPFGSLASPSTYGGFGAGTNCFWVDPERELVSVFFSVGGLEESYSVERHARYSDMVQASVVA